MQIDRLGRCITIRGGGWEHARINDLLQGLHGVLPWKESKVRGVISKRYTLSFDNPTEAEQAKEWLDEQNA